LQGKTLAKVNAGDIGDRVVSIEDRQGNIVKEFMEIIRVFLEVIFGEMNTRSSFDWPSTEGQIR
jgi:hypothetical protein